MQEQADLLANMLRHEKSVQDLVTNENLRAAGFYDSQHNVGAVTDSTTEENTTDPERETVQLVPRQSRDKGASCQAIELVSQIPTQLASAFLRDPLDLPFSSMGYFRGS